MRNSSVQVSGYSVHKPFSIPHLVLLFVLLVRVIPKFSAQLGRVIGAFSAIYSQAKTSLSILSAPTFSTLSTGPIINTSILKINLHVISKEQNK